MSGLAMCLFRKIAVLCVSLNFGLGALQALPMSDVDFIIGDGDRSTYDRRIHKVHALGDNLHPEVQAKLMRYLETEVSAQQLGESALASLKNDIMDKLIAQKVFPRSLVALSLAQIDDVSQGDIWREYVGQKFSEMYLRLVKTEDELSDPVLEKLWAETRNSHYIHAGTALLGLSRIMKARPERIEKQRFLDAALAVVQGEEYSYPNKITALQVAAKYGDSRVAVEARIVLLAPKQPIMLKVSALITLGMVGDESDLPLLQRYAKSPEYRLRKAAKNALNERS